MRLLSEAEKMSLVAVIKMESDWLLMQRAKFCNHSWL